MATNVTRKTDSMVFDVINAVAGALMVFAPWLLGFAAVAAAAWNAWIIGAAVVVVALVAIFYVTQWEPWAYLVLGLWLIVAPWALGFSGVTMALYAHLAAGAIVAVVGAIALWYTRPMSTA